MSSNSGSTADTGTDDWETHWSDYGDTAQMNPAQAYRRRIVLDLLGLRPGDRLVDIGSGQGDLIADIAGSSTDVELLGLELGAAGIAQAVEKVPSARFVQTDLLAGDPPDVELLRWGTAGVCSEVLEHVDQPEKLLGNALAYLSPGARVVITVPGGPRSAFDKHIGHRQHFNAARLRAVLDAAGLRTERILRAGFPFFNLYKLATIAHGEKLIEESKVTAADDQQTHSGALRAFDLLFRANARSTPFGWQMIAIGTVPPAS